MVTYISERFTYKMGGGEKRLVLSPYVQGGPKKIRTVFDSRQLK